VVGCHRGLSRSPLQASHDAQVEIHAISFDADQTLWDFQGVYQKALDATVNAMIERGYVQDGAVSAAGLVAVRDEIASEHQGRPHSLEEVRERSFAVFLERAGFGDPDQAAASLVDLYMQVRFDAIELYPEVRSSLQRIKQQYPIGLITNGNTYPDRCGLPDTFDAQVLGPEHGFEKPDPRAFTRLAHLLAIDVRHLLHVGDGRDDVEGANGVGATSVFINRIGAGAHPAWALAADHQISNLEQLETLLG